MRILALSDSHKNKFACAQAIKNQPTADIVVFLGDGEDDFDYGRQFIKTPLIFAVRGNRDLYSPLPDSQIIEADKKLVYITHGHIETVKSGTQRLYETAKHYNCTLGLYGHTHVQKYEYIDGIHLYCPGSLANEEYGVIDITDNGIICINMKCR